MANIRHQEPLLYAFLKRLEFTDEQISGFSLSTSLQHDLGEIGDNLLDDLEVMHREFGVDLTNFNWTRYTPSEGERLFPASLLSRLRGTYRPLAEYEPITLGLLARALQTKMWPEA